MNSVNKNGVPVIGISGFSGSGKTTLIEQLIPLLIAKGLQVAVLKSDAHGLVMDTPGKDSYRFFEAGADVFIHDSNQSCLRHHLGNPLFLPDIVKVLSKTNDLILVEGYKSGHLPNKIWLLNDGEKSAPTEIGDFSLVLSRECDRVVALEKLIEQLLSQVLGAQPIWCGVLIGGKSSRMGEPKHLLKMGDQTWIEKIVATVDGLVNGVALLGRGELPGTLSETIPVIPDAPDRQGPIAALTAAMRWNPDVSWLILSCDLPYITKEAVNWLLAQRTVGQTAVIPVLDKPEPLFAWYHPRSKEYLEQAHAPRDILKAPRVAKVVPSATIRTAWHNINTPQQLEADLGHDACGFLS